MAAIVTAGILYGSLYPFAFHARNGSALQELLRTWAVPPSGRADLIANILLYLPFGFCAALAIGSGHGIWRRVAPVTLAGLVLSVGVEVTQFYDAGRVTNASDLYLNALGSFLGALGGVVVGADFRWPLLRDVAARPFPVLLLIAWIGYRLYPYVPTTDLHKYWRALKPVIEAPGLPPYALFRYTVVWLIVGYLVESVLGPRRWRAGFPLLAAFLLGAKIMIVDKVLTAPEIAGAGLAYAISFALVGRGRWRVGVLAALLGALIVALRLEPFQFHAAAGRFGWIPFLSLLYGSLDVDVQVFLEKFFLYGSLIWLLVQSGMRIGGAGLLAAALLLTTSLAEIYLPGRSAEITDAVMALLVAGILAIVTNLAPAAGMRARAAG